MRDLDTPVVIAGSGPVGMTLALVLAQRGVRSIVLERNATTTSHPKMDLTNGRSMELFRRLGIARDLRAVGVPEDQPLDIVWVTSPRGQVLHRFAYPTPAASAEHARVRNDGRWPREAGMRVSQIVIEPVLKAKMEQSPLIDVRFGRSFESYRQDAAGVTSQFRDTASGTLEELRSAWLVGCDGGGSAVRRCAGIAMEGQHEIAALYTIHFRSTRRDILSPFGPVFHLQSGHGTLIAQNAGDIWTLHCFAPRDSDPGDLVRHFVRRDFEFDIILSNPWCAHMVVAERYRADRVFLAGDSAHQVIPTGGYGMNTGIGDAFDLGWKLAATIQGWGGEALLGSYEPERRPIALQNREAAFRHAGVRQRIGEAIHSAEAEGDLEASGAAARRARLGKQIAALGNMENESWGIEHGYRCTPSAVIAGHDPRAFNPDHYDGSLVVGGRLPHYFLGDGTALIDRLGSDFTLLAIGDAGVGDAVAAARETGLPLTVVHLPPEPVLERLEHPLILVRPDLHVAWAGANIQQDWRAILALVSGSARVESRRDVAA